MIYLVVVLSLVIFFFFIRSSLKKILIIHRVVQVGWYRPWLAMPLLAKAMLLIITEASRGDRLVVTIPDKHFKPSKSSPSILRLANG